MTCIMSLKNDLQQEKWRDNFSDILDELKRLFEL